jgi:hypothetical protein
VPDIKNVYELLAFLLVAGLQIYTRWSVAQLAKKQEVINAHLSANHSNLMRLVEHTAGVTANNALISINDAAAAIEGALRVAYFQGQADVGTARAYPEARAAKAVAKLLEIVMHAAGPEKTAIGPSTAKAAEEMIKVALEARNGGGPPGSPPIEH